MPKAFETVLEVINYINDDVTCLKPLYERLQQIFNPDPSHDLGHLLRVALWVTKLFVEERHQDWIRLLNMRQAIIVGLYHDVYNLPKNHPDRAKASTKSREIAEKELLKFRNCFSDDQIEYMCVAIEDHSYSKAVVARNYLGLCLQDADRLDAIGMVGILRTVAVGIQMGNELFDYNDPWCYNRTPNDQRYVLDHCKQKLFRLTFNFRISKDEAENRFKSMKFFLTELGIDIGVKFLTV